MTEYHRLAELGFLKEDDHIELIRGELIQMTAKGTAHETCITRLLGVLPGIIGDRAPFKVELTPRQLWFQNRGPLPPNVITAKWTLDQYHQMIEAGILNDQRVELLNGEIIEMSPKGEPHAFYSHSVAKYV